MQVREAGKRENEARSAKGRAHGADRQLVEWSICQTVETWEPGDRWRRGGLKGSRDSTGEGSGQLAVGVNWSNGRVVDWSDSGGYQALTGGGSFCLTMRTSAGKKVPS
jgi:hypothetical protein